jgi:hypothetical protein
VRAAGCLLPIDEEHIMLRTVTATYGSRDTLRNVVDDILGVGIEREKVFVDDEAMLVKVMIPSDTEPEVLEILGRHNPLSLH